MLNFLKKAISSIAEKIKPKEEPSQRAPLEEVEGRAGRAEEAPAPSPPKKEQKGQPPLPRAEEEEREGGKRDAGEERAPSPEAEKAPSQGKEKKVKGRAKGGKLKAKVGIGKRLTSLLSPTVKIEEKDVRDALEDFELYLLKAEVALPVVDELKEELAKRLVGREVEKRRLSSIVEEEAADVLASSVKGESIWRWKPEEGPFVVMLMGPNGSGKTTTAAKLAHFFKSKGLRPLLVAADTFRAGSVEQLKEHAARIGVDVYERGYGVKPSTVIYEAMQRAKDYDVVIIDTAGRQEVNANLMKELEKMVKVANPHVKLYVVEAVGGNAVFDQLSTYSSLVGVDGLIITKLDLDERGGVLLSASHASKAPVVFISMGQSYDELKPYSKELVLSILKGEHDSG